MKISSFFVIIEIILLCLGSSIFIYRPGLRVSESLSSGITLALLTLSCIFQGVFLIGEPKLAFVIEGLVVFGMILILIRKREYLWHFFQQICSFFKKEFIAIPVLIVWIYLALEAVLLPPSNWDSMRYNLSRVLLFQQYKTLFLTDVATTQQAIDHTWEIYPVGADLLHHAFLRFYTDYGIAIFGFLAYLSISFGSYALSRRYVSQQISLTASLVIISLPQLVYQATNTKNDITVAAAAIFCILTVYRLLDRLNFADFSLLVLGFLFGISTKTTFIAFVIPFTLFFGLLLLHKYGIKNLIKLVSQNRFYIVALMLPAFILSQLWLFIHNHYVWGSWSGPPSRTLGLQQLDGIKGGLANLVRYCFQSAHYLKHVDLLFNKIFGFYLSHFFQKTYDFFLYPVFGNAGLMRFADRPFTIVWKPHEDFSWYGPFGLLIILVIVYAAIKGKNSLRALSLTLLSFAFIISFKLAWQVFGGNRFLLPFFALSSTSIAFSLKMFRKQKFTLKLIRYIAIVILLYASIFNQSKPLLINASKPFFSLTQQSIWTKTNFGANRLYYTEKHYYGNSGVAEFTRFVKPHSDVAIVASRGAWIYPFILLNPEVKFTPVTQSFLESRMSDFDYILCLNDKDGDEIDCDYENTEYSTNILWTRNSDNRKRHAQLIDLSE